MRQISTIHVDVFKNSEHWSWCVRIKFTNGHPSIRREGFEYDKVEAMKAAIVAAMQLGVPISADDIVDDSEFSSSYCGNIFLSKDI